MKAPNSKLQHPEKFRTSTSKSSRAALVLELGRLKFLWSLDNGAWSFPGVVRLTSLRKFLTARRSVREVLCA
jgi:hypothetical protein